ncbi:hypothetical protein [Nevskia soli]|uniref:hypothetical protein n=1 Tax=Nevskia soli TaxID=418856 RepID=UPI0004A6F37E|nr:hypothetical protein [Nevskia soli]
MAQSIRLLGWLDPELPARWKESGQYEFRIKLSEIPSSAWKKTFHDLSKNQAPAFTIEQDIVVLACELSEIEANASRIKQRLELVNQTVVRQEREVDERVARQMSAAEEVRKKILAAVEGIRFD